jgi:hypothetical protein
LHLSSSSSFSLRLLGKHGFDLDHQLRDALFLLENVIGELFRRKMFEINFPAPASSISSIVSKPSTNSPKIVYLPSRCATPPCATNQAASSGRYVGVRAMHS